MDQKKVGVGFGVLIQQNGKILLGRRHGDPDKADSVFRVANVWTMPGGKLDYGEDFITGARREIKKETGIFKDCAARRVVQGDRNSPKAWRPKRKFRI